MMHLMRRYVYGFVNSHDFAVATQIMAADYTLHVGTESLVGRDDHYLPAVQRQMDQFPTLGYSIHELLTDGERTAVLFSEHGASARVEGRRATWVGVGIYRRDGDRLAECWVEQDHYGKRRQLESGVCDAVPPVAADPWAGHDGATTAATDAATPAVRTWLAGLEMWPPPGAQLDAGAARDEQARIRIADTQLNAVVAEGDRVAFHVQIRGSYEGGLPGFEERRGAPVTTWATVLGDLTGSGVTNLRGAGNRIALVRQLRESA